MVSKQIGGASDDCLEPCIITARYSADFIPSSLLFWDGLICRSKKKKKPYKSKSRGRVGGWPWNKFTHRPIFWVKMLKFNPQFLYKLKRFELKCADGCPGVRTGWP